MTLPDRPVSGASIESVWGQEIHDYTFAPAGCAVSGTGVLITTTPAVLDLSVVVDDPGGYLGSDNITIPTGGEGLYLINARAKSGDGITGQGARYSLLKNGSYAVHADIDLETSVVTQLPNITALMTLTAGDVLTFTGKRTGSAGGAPYINIEELNVVRLGAEYGTP